MEASKLPVKLYIETRPEGVNQRTVHLLKRLQVDGVGMGLELSSETFRKGHLNRFSAQGRIQSAFEVLRMANIKRTSYNIIGLPYETEDMILKTIEFNHSLNPDNITVSFYSPFMGTQMQKEAVKMSDFNEYELDADSQLRSLSKSAIVDRKTLAFYKKHFVTLVREGADKVDIYKKNWMRRS